MSFSFRVHLIPPFSLPFLHNHQGRLPQDQWTTSHSEGPRGVQRAPRIVFRLHRQSFEKEQVSVSNPHLNRQIRTGSIRDWSFSRGSLPVPDIRARGRQSLQGLCGPRSPSPLQSIRHFLCQQQEGRDHV